MKADPPTTKRPKMTSSVSDNATIWIELAKYKSLNDKKLD